MIPPEFLAPGSLAGLRVLYAEDEPTLRETVAHLLEAQGCRVSAARDGVEALAVIQEQTQPFPVVITDRHMPRMDGLQLVRKLREIGYPARVILFSSAGLSALAEEFRGLTIDAVVEKTNPVTVLLSAIKLASIAAPASPEEKSLE